MNINNEEPKKHFVCTGECEGVSESPKKCGAPDCIKYNEPLLECECFDGEHSDVKK